MPHARNRRRWLAIFLLTAVSISAFIIYLQGLTKCWTTTYECSFEGIGDFAGGDYPPTGDPAIPPPSLYSGAYGVSADGLKVVGSGTVDRFGAGHQESRVALGWTSPAGSAGFWNPGDPPGRVELGYGSAPGDVVHHSHASRISGDGQVVVGTVQVGGTQQPARWVAATVATLPPGPDGNVAGEATGVSENGKVIVGYTCLSGRRLPYGSDWTAPRQAVRWHEWGGYSAVELPDTFAGAGTNASRADAVSADGETIVGAVYNASTGGTAYPALWWRIAPPTPPPPGPPFRLVVLADNVGAVVPGAVVGITADGNIAVGAIGVYPNLRACYWTVTAPVIPPVKATLIPLLPGDCGNAAFCATNIGGLRVFGTRTLPRENGDCDSLLASFVWDINQGIQDLATYMNTNGAIPPGWVIEQVTSASENGLTLVGTGDNNGTYEGWVYRCKVITTSHWCPRRLIGIKIPPPTKAPPPIDPLIRR